MRHHRSISVVALLFLLNISASTQDNKYNITFESNTVTVTRSRIIDTTVVLFFKAALSNDIRNSNDYKVVIAADTRQPNLPLYTFAFDPRPFSEISTNQNTLNSVRLVLIKDTSSDKKEITLKINITKAGLFEPEVNNTGEFKEVKIIATAPPVVSPAVADSFSLYFESAEPMQRGKQDNIYPIYINAKGLGNFKNDSSYKVSVVVDKDSSDISPMRYSIDFPDKYFYQLNTKDSSKNTVYLKINKDSMEDRPRSLVLAIEVKKGTAVDNNNKGEPKKMRITIKGITPPNDTLKAYNYLAYVGTNFDLVDGPKAKNLFFATNILLSPTKGKGLGMYLSLYGNRTMTETDTLGNIDRTTNVITLTDTTYKLFTDKYNMARTQVSDNLGAYISPLIKLWGASSLANKLQLYYTPSLEFVWRRTNINSVFTSSNRLDSSIENGKFTGSIDAVSNSNVNFNEFVFNVGALGFMVIHESSEISVRVHCSVGYCSIYRPRNSGLTKGSVDQPLQSNYTTYGDLFFCGRAWITESTTGLTLQAEVTNTLLNRRPFYGVTLSKAFNFKNIGRIFQPIIPKPQS